MNKNREDKISVLSWEMSGNGDEGFEWDQFIDLLDDLLWETFGGNDWWHISVENFGWRKTSGVKVCRADNATELLQAFLPRADCEFKIFKEDNGSLSVQNFHHDSPIGEEWYTIRRATEEEKESL